MPFHDTALFKNRLINVGVLLLCVIIAAKIYQFQVNQMNNLRAQQQEEQKKNNLLENIKGLERTLRAYAGVLRDRDESAVMNIVNTHAQAVGFKIESVRPGVQQRYQQYAKMPYFLEGLVPDYHVLGQFLSNVESDQSFFIVERLNAQKDSTGKELSVQITLSTVSLSQ